MLCFLLGLHNPPPLPMLHQYRLFSRQVEYTNNLSLYSTFCWHDAIRTHSIFFKFLWNKKKMKRHWIFQPMHSVHNLSHLLAH